MHGKQCISNLTRDEVNFLWLATANEEIGLFFRRKLSCQYRRLMSCLHVKDPSEDISGIGSGSVEM